MITAVTTRKDHPATVSGNSQRECRRTTV